MLTVNLLEGKVLKENSGLFPREYDVSLNVAREVTASHSPREGSPLQRRTTREVSSSGTHRNSSRFFTPSNGQKPPEVRK